MKHTEKTGTLPQMTATVLLVLLAACLLLVLLGGAAVYVRVTRRTELAHDCRTGIQYIATRVRQAQGEVETVPFGQGQALALTQTVDGTEYWTRIYCHDGYLMELFTEKDGDFEPRDGERLVRAEALDVTCQEGLVHICLTGDGQVSRLSLSLKGGSAP